MLGLNHSIFLSMGQAARCLAKQPTHLQKDRDYIGKDRYRITRKILEANAIKKGGTKYVSETSLQKHSYKTRQKDCLFRYELINHPMMCSVSLILFLLKFTWASALVLSALLLCPCFLARCLTFLSICTNYPTSPPWSISCIARALHFTSPVF